MKIKNATSAKKYILSALAVALLIGCGVGAFFIYNENRVESSTTSVNLDEPTDDQKKAGEQSKSSTIDSDTSNSNTDTSSESSKNNTSSSQDTQSDSTTTGMQITANTQNDGIYQLRVLINTVVSNSTCTLILTKDNHMVTKTAKAQALAQSSTCEGFNIPTSELEPGTWQITVKLEGDATGSTTGSIVIR